MSFGLQNRVLGADSCGFLLAWFDGLTLGPCLAGRGQPDRASARPQVEGEVEDMEMKEGQSTLFNELDPEPRRRAAGGQRTQAGVDRLRAVADGYDD